MCIRDRTRYPLIVFSHGGISTKSSNESLYHELASNGYVVCSIDHTYHCLFTTDKEGHTTFIDKGYMQELFSEDAKSDRQQSYEYYQKWMKIRIGDINFVIDVILSEAEGHEADTVYQLVDTAKIGVMGHSAGGSAALGIGRMRDDVGAVVALESPFMCDIEGVENGEFVFVDEVYPVPVLNVYSDSCLLYTSSVPSGRYDASTGTVTFATTHFSHYAVAYVTRVFDDLDNVAWAKKQIEVLAAKGIMDGKATGEFEPQAAITRAEYVSALVRVLGVNATPEGRFDDVEEGSKYCNEISIAKKLSLIHI